MLTLDSLQEYGANTKEGMSRCMDNEAFYFRLINMAVEDAGFDRLKEAVENGNMDAAFEAAHALKGMLGNLALTPMSAPASEMTELLRAHQEADYNAYLQTILEQREILRSMI